MNRHRRRKKKFCELAQCSGIREFIVDHPFRGTLEVCSRHAENIEEIGGEVVGFARAAGEA
jgi:hypothetical protein